MASATPVAFPDMAAVETMMVELGNARCKSLGIGRQDNFNAIIHRPRDAHHNASTKTVVGRIYQHRTYSVNKPNGRIIWVYERASDNMLFLLKPRKGPLAYKVWLNDQTFSEGLWIYGQNWLQDEKAAEVRGKLDLQQWLRINRPQDAGTTGEYLPYKAHLAQFANSTTTTATSSTAATTSSSTTAVAGADATIHVTTGTAPSQVAPTHSQEDLDAAQTLLEISGSRPADVHIKQEDGITDNDAALTEASGSKTAIPATKKRSITASKTSKSATAKDKPSAPVRRTSRKRKATEPAIEAQATSRPSKTRKTSAKKDIVQAPPARTNRKRKATEADLGGQPTSKASKTSRGKKSAKSTTTEATTAQAPSTTAITTDTTAKATTSKAKASKVVEPKDASTKTRRKRKATDADLDGEIPKEPPTKKGKAQHTTTKKASKRKVADADLDKETTVAPATKKTKMAPVKKTKAAPAKKDVPIPSRSSARITQRKEKAAMDEEVDPVVSANALEGTALGEHMRSLGIDIAAVARKADESDALLKKPPRLYNALRLLQDGLSEEEQQQDAALSAAERQKKHDEYCERRLGFDGYQFPTSDIRGEVDPNFEPLHMKNTYSRSWTDPESVNDDDDGDNSEAADPDDLPLDHKNARKPTSRQPSETLSNDREVIDRDSYSPDVKEAARKLMMRLAKDKTSVNPEVIDVDAPAPVKKTGRKATSKKSKKTANTPEAITRAITPPPPPARYVTRKPTLKYSKRMALNAPEDADVETLSVKDNATKPNLMMSKVSTMYEYSSDGNKISENSRTHEDSAVAVKAPTMAPAETPFKAYGQSDHLAKPDVSVKSVESNESSKPHDKQLTEMAKATGSQQADVITQTTESVPSELQASTDLPSSTGLQSFMDMQAITQSLAVNETGQTTELPRTIEEQQSSEPEQPSEGAEPSGH